MLAAKQNQERKQVVLHVAHDVQRLVERDLYLSKEREMKQQRERKAVLETMTTVRGIESV